MALFIRRQDSENQLFKIARDLPSESMPPEEDGLTKLIIGLGNVGKKYENTRHNVGFLVIDAYAKSNDFPKWHEKSKFKAFISEDFVAGKKIILAKPTTLYNLSGESVRALADFYKISPRDIVIVHDELDLPFGSVKEKLGGGSAGSNGLKSIISHVGADFRRIRIGIKNDLLDSVDPADFVLSKFSSDEKKQLPKILAAVIEKI